MLTLELTHGGSPPDFTAGRQVNLWRDERGEVCARLFAGASHRWIEWPGLGVFWFDRTAPVVRVQPDPGVPADLLHATFARILQPAILQAMGWQALHASAVETSSGVRAFCGPAHAGKSTIAYALAETGLRHFADDAVVLGLGAGEVRAHALPFEARLRTSAREHFGLRLLSGVQPDRDYSAPLAACFLLTQDETLDGPPRRTHIPAARAFTELMTHAHCFDPDHPDESRRLVEDFLSIVTRVPVFSLVYRPGFDRLPELVDAIMDERELAVAGH
jgi:hypothetical protein